MLKIKVKTNPSIEHLQSTLKKVEAEVFEDLREFWEKRAVKIVAQEVGRMFATEGLGAWAPLNSKYAARKAKVYPMRTILRLSNAFFKAATDRRSGANVFEFSKDKMTYGVNSSKFPAPYPLFHERGTSKMPARPIWSILGKSVVLKRNMVISLRLYLKQKVRETFKSQGYV